MTTAQVETLVAEIERGLTKLATGSTLALAVGARLRQGAEAAGGERLLADLMLTQIRLHVAVARAVDRLAEARRATVH